MSTLHPPARAWAATRRSPPAAAAPALSPGLPSAGWGQQGADQSNQQLRTSKPSKPSIPWNSVIVKFTNKEVA